MLKWDALRDAVIQLKGKSQEGNDLPLCKRNLISFYGSGEQRIVRWGLQEGTCQLLTERNLNNNESLKQVGCLEPSRFPWVLRRRLDGHSPGTAQRRYGYCPALRFGLSFRFVDVDVLCCAKALRFDYVSIHLLLLLFLLPWEMDL